MSRIYTVGANRNVGNAYSNLTVMKDARMKHIERMTRLIGSVATQVVFIDDDMPHFDYRPIYYFEVYFDGIDPLDSDSDDDGVSDGETVIMFIHSKSKRHSPSLSSTAVLCVCIDNKMCGAVGFF